jgi:trk system potassium uptake protein TrkH
MTTTGFATADFDVWLPVTHILLLAAMFIGGSSGSTAGGTKVIRFIVALKVSAKQVEKAYRSRVIRPLKVNGKSLSLGEQETIMVYIVILTLIIFSGTLLISFLEPAMSFEGTVSSMAACIFNIGPGFAEIGPTRNFAGLHAYTQVFLSMLMIMGRLELFALLVLFSPSLWKRF